jgi:hypothetical protein
MHAAVYRQYTNETAAYPAKFRGTPTSNIQTVLVYLILKTRLERQKKGYVSAFKILLNTK